MVSKFKEFKKDTYKHMNELREVRKRQMEFKEIQRDE